MDFCPFFFTFSMLASFYLQKSVSIIVVAFRLRSVSESGRSPGSTGSPGSSGDRSTLEARNCSRTSSGIFCRICHDGEGAEALISPCQCSGKGRGGGRVEKELKR